MEKAGIDQGAARTARELRIQLAQMTMASQSLERTATDEKSRGHLAVLNQSICRMLRVVGRLELSLRLGGEGAQAELVLTDLARVVNGLGGRMGQLLAYAGVELTVKAPELLLAMADEELIGQMVMELVANAAKAVKDKAGGHVRLTLVQQGNRAVFTVEDNGPGVAPDRLAYLFCSGEEAVPDWRRGGVGVAIARQAAALHGGMLVADCAEGRGLRAVASIPLGEAGENLLRGPGAAWDRGGFDNELIALSGLLPAKAFQPGERSGKRGP